MHPAASTRESSSNGKAHEHMQARGDIALTKSYCVEPLPSSFSVIGTRRSDARYRLIGSMSLLAPRVSVSHKFGRPLNLDISLKPRLHLRVPAPR